MDHEKQTATTITYEIVDTHGDQRETVMTIYTTTVTAAVFKDFL